MKPSPRALRRALVPLAALSAGTVLSVAPAQAVSTQQSYWVPVNKHIVVVGHGFGHGHGMSQYGAEGAALAGLSYDQIIDFYYPGTTWSKVRGQVRVLISEDTTSDVVVSPAAGLTLTDLGDQASYPLPDQAGVTRWRITVSSDGGTVVAYRTQRWHRFRPGRSEERRVGTACA